MSGLGVLEKAGMLGPACQDSCLCPVSSTREERLGTPACPRAEAAGLEEWLRLQPSVGQRRGKEGTQGPPAPCLPPQRHGFLLTSWRSLGTAPSEQAMAGPRHKQPRAQSTNRPLQPIQWRPQGGLDTRHCQPPRFQFPCSIRAEACLTTAAARGCC